MPAVAFYAVLTSRVREESGALLAMLISVVVLLTLVAALWKWTREQTLQWRNTVITCALPGCFMGCRYIPEAARLIKGEPETPLYTRADIAESAYEFKHQRARQAALRRDF